MEFSEDLFKRRIAAVLPTHLADRVGKVREPSTNGSVHPQVTDVGDLPRISDDERFLQEAYRRILGRECDVPGFVNYLELLRGHVPRRIILLQLINSEEARSRGMQFTGIHEAAPSPDRRSRVWAFTGAFGRLTAVARDVIRRILFTRFDSIDHKLNFLLREVTTRTDNLSAKTDQSLWTLSEKLDAYVSGLLDEQRRNREAVALHGSQIREFGRSLDFVTRLLVKIESLTASFGQNFSNQRARLEHLTGLVRADLRSLLGSVNETTGGLSRRLASVDGALAHSRERDVRLAKTLGQVLAVVDNLNLDTREKVLLESIHALVIGAMDDLKCHAAHAIAQSDGRAARSAESLTQLLAISETISAKSSSLAREQRWAQALLLEAVNANSTSLAGEQQRASSLLAEEVARTTNIDRGQQTLIDSTSASAAAILERIRPPVISAGNDVLVTEVEGFIVGVPGDEWRMAAYHAFRGVLEPGVTKHFRRIVQPGMIVVDVGANIGMYTLVAARILGGQGKVYSFEPTPRTYKLLKDNVQVNGFLEAGTVNLREAAVTDRCGTAQLAIYAADCGHNTLFSDGQSDGQVEVSTVALDEILALEARIDIVKIDAEGAEPFILRGMRRIIERSPGIRILLEFAPIHLQRAGVDPGGFLDELNSLGFAVHRIDDQTGELLTASREELTSAFSAELEISSASTV